MEHDHLEKRLTKNRPMTTISMRLPADVIADLKRVAPLRGISGYQPLIRAYIGQCLRADLEKLEGDPLAALVDALRRRGVKRKLLRAALAEMGR